MSPRRTAATVLALTLALTPVAHADRSLSIDEERIAQTHFLSGTEHFRAHRYAEAAKEFEIVFQISSQVPMLFNLARAHELAGNLPAAIDAYQRFLDGGAPDIGTDAVREMITLLKQRQSAPAVTTPTAAAPVCRETSSGTALLRLRIVHVEYRRSTLNEVGPFVLGGAGLVLGAFSAWQGVSSQANAALFAQANMGMVTWGRDVQNAYDAAPRESAVAIALGATAGAALVGSVVWLAVRGRGERIESVQAFVTPTDHGAALSIGGRF